MLLVANWGQSKSMQKPWEMTEILSHGYSSESTRWELSNGYQNDRVYMIFKNLACWVLDESNLSFGRVKIPSFSTHLEDPLIIQ